MPSELDKYLQKASPEEKAKLQELGKQTQAEPQPLTSNDRMRNHAPTPQVHHGDPPTGDPSGRLDPKTAQTIQNVNDAPQGDSFNRSSRANESNGPNEPKNSLADRYPAKQEPPKETQKEQDKEPER